MSGQPSNRLATLLALAWPMVLARSSQAVIGLSDAFMSAPLGEASLAAVTTGAINIFAAAMLPIGLVFIIQSFAAQLTGRGDAGAARRYGYYGLVFAAAAGVLALAAVPLIPAVLSLFDYEPAVEAAMADYLAIRVLAIAPVIGVEALGNWFGGLGRTRVHMNAGLIAMVTNVAGNYLLIEGNLGAPALGVEGAAIASAVASALAFAYLALEFARAKTAAPTGRLRMSEFVRVLRFGFPNGLSWSLEFAAFTIYLNVVVASLGTTVLAAMMVVFNVNSVAFMPAFGLASSGAILVGQAIGEGRKDEVPAILWMTMRVAALWQGAIAVLYVAAPALIMSLFAPPAVGEAAIASADLVAIGATMLLLSAGWQLTDAIAMSLSETLRAAGDTTWPLWARVILAWFVFIPLSVLGVMKLGGGHVMAMICIIVYIGLIAAVLAWRFRSGAWRHIDLVGDGDLPPEALG